METPKVLYCFPNSAGELFMPSNGSEGDWFTSAFCARCIHEKFWHTQQHGDKQCDIFTKTLIEDSVPEWVYNAEGWPVCTAWQHWDWGREDDDDGLNEPPEPPTNDPNQLLLPFMLDEIMDSMKTPVTTFTPEMSVT